MLQDFFNDIRLVDEADDLYLPLTLGTDKRVYFIDFSDEVGPSFFKFLGYRLGLNTNLSRCWRIGSKTSGLLLRSLKPKSCA